MGIEDVIIDVIEGKRKSRACLFLLHFLSILYQMIVRIRNILYDLTWLKSHKSSLPVVSVGNLVAGGTGKTPFIQKLTQELSQIPGEIAILTRGYRSQAESHGVIASDGDGPVLPASICGDEAYWLALTTKASLWVGKDRIQNLSKIENSDARLILLEDGFQHRKMARDIDIVLLSAKDLFGKGYFLPRGYLRESPESLLRADVIVVTHIEAGMDLQKIEQRIQSFSSAPIIGFSSRYIMREQWKGKKIGAFCGIAKPSSFYEALCAEGNDVVKTLTSPDHKIPSLQELSLFVLECQKLGAEAIYCTEKDLVKLEPGYSFVLPIEVLTMNLVCTWNENIWKEMVRSIQTSMRK